MPVAIHIDFETRSAVDLKRSTTHAYSLDPSTDVWCMAYAIGDGEVKLWVNGEPFPQDILDVAKSGQEYYFIAHNAHFELTIWNNLCCPRYGWPKLPLHRTYCTMAMAYAMALPGSLENAAIATGLEVRKDKEGRDLMIRMANPRPRRDKTAPITWFDDGERKARLFAYCKNDVVVERALEKRLRPLSPAERDLWLLDCEINNRGIGVDTLNIARALQTIESEKQRLNAKMDEATGGLVSGVSDVLGIKFVLALHGYRTADIAKADIRELLSQPDLPEMVRTMLELRQEGAKSSTAKLKAMLEAATSLDSRVRGTMQYHGAGTGRWAGRKVQPQNLTRGELGLSEADIEDAIAHIDDPAYLSAFYGPPMTVISDIIRSMIIAREGHEFIQVDFSSIEARVLAWLAGQQSVLDVFLSGKDIYKYAAAGIFNVPYKQVTKAQRQVGKTAILALGYQGGFGAFQTMATGYNVDMTEAYEPLMAVATERQIAMSEALWQKYLTKNPLTTVTRQIFMASDLTKRLWREANPAIVEYWYNLEGAAMSAILDPGKTYEVKIPGNFSHRHIQFTKSGSFLWCRLPSGRKICYPYAVINEIIPPWEEDELDPQKKPAMRYMGVNSVTRVWEKETAYGGLLAENITQAVARDFLVNGINQAEANDYPVTFHVHDELVTEVPIEFGSVKELETLITVPPEWGFDCPIAAEGWRGRRYRK